jgi:hypothetical protein
MVQHHIDVARGRIRDQPRLRFVSLLLSGELAHVAAEPIFVLHHLGTAIGVDDRIIARRHDLAVHRLRGIQELWAKVGDGVKE